MTNEAKTGLVAGGIVLGLAAVVAGAIVLANWAPAGGGGGTSAPGLVPGTTVSGSVEHVSGAGGEALVILARGGQEFYCYFADPSQVITLRGGEWVTIAGREDGRSGGRITLRDCSMAWGR